jgi:hypothetical protein
MVTKLQTVINASFRFVKNLKRRTHTSQLLKDHGWLTMQGRIELRLSIIVYNVLKTGQPSYLYKLLSMTLPSRNLRSAQMNLLLCPRIRSEIGSRGFYHSGPTICNRIPLNVREASSVSSFQNSLRRSFFLDKQ